MLQGPWREGGEARKADTSQQSQRPSRGGWAQGDESEGPRDPVSWVVVALGVGEGMGLVGEMDRVGRSAARHQAAPQRRKEMRP
jgi:hypothetical protein